MLLNESPYHQLFRRLALEFLFVIPHIFPFRTDASGKVLAHCNSFLEANATCLFTGKEENSTGKTSVHFGWSNSCTILENNKDIRTKHIYKMWLEPYNILWCQRQQVPSSIYTVYTAEPKIITVSVSKRIAISWYLFRHCHQSFRRLALRNFFLRHLTTFRFWLLNNFLVLAQC